MHMLWSSSQDLMVHVHELVLVSWSEVDHFSVELIYRLGSVPFAWLSIWILSFLLPVFGHSVAGWPGHSWSFLFLLKNRHGVLRGYTGSALCSNQWAKERLWLVVSLMSWNTSGVIVSACIFTVTMCFLGMEIWCSILQGWPLMVIVILLDDNGGRA